MFQFVLSVLFRRSINTTKLLTLRKFTKIIKNLQELQNSIYPQYQEFTALINDQRKAKQCSHSEDLKVALNKHGEILHKEIDSIIKRKQSEIEDRDTQYLTSLNNQKDAIKHTMKEINKSFQIKREKFKLVTFSIQIQEQRIQKTATNNYNFPFKLQTSGYQQRAASSTGWIIVSFFE